MRNNENTEGMKKNPLIIKKKVLYYFLVSLLFSSETSMPLYILLQTILKFELQYAWMPPQIFFCGFRVLQLLCHNVEGVHDIKYGQK